MPSKFTVAAEGHHSGSLVKLARYSKRNWKSRYFTLTASPPELCYFKKKGDAKEAGKVIVDASTTVEHADARPNCFRVSNNSYGDLFLQAPSKKEMETWMAKISFVARLGMQTKKAWRKSVVARGGSAPGSPVGGVGRARAASAGASSSSASSTAEGASFPRSSSASAAPRRKRRNVKVQLTIEKFLADRAHCRRFYEEADGLILPHGGGTKGGGGKGVGDGKGGTAGAVSSSSSSASASSSCSSSSSSSGGGGGGGGGAPAPNVESLFPTKTRKAGVSDRLKGLLGGVAIAELSIPTVTTTAASAASAAAAAENGGGTGGGGGRPVRRISQGGGAGGAERIFRVHVQLTDDAGEWTVERTAGDFWNMHQDLCETYPKLGDRISFPTGMTASSSTVAAAAGGGGGGVDAVDGVRQECAAYLGELADIQLYGANLEELWEFLLVYEHLPKLLRGNSIDGADAALDEAAAAAAASADAVSSRKHRGPCLQRMHEMALSDPQGYKKLATSVRGIISGLVSATARSIKEYAQSWVARAKTGMLTPERMKELKEVRQYVEYQAHEIVTKQGEALLRKMPSCPRQSFETFVYLEVEAAVIPPLREQLYRYLEMETHEDDVLILQNIRRLQARGLPLPQAAFGIEAKMHSAANYVKSIRLLDDFVHEERPSVQLELILDFVETVQNEACEALRENNNDLMDLAADDLLPLMTYVIASSTAFLNKPYTSLQFIRELAYHVAARGEAMYFLTSLESAVYFMRDFEENMRQGHPDNEAAALAAASPKPTRKSLRLSRGAHGSEDDPLLYEPEEGELGGGGEDGAGGGGFTITPDAELDVTITRAYLKDVDDSSHKVPHYMAVSEAIGSGKVAVAHFRYSDLHGLHMRLCQDPDSGPLPRFPERSKYDVLMRLHLKTKSLDRSRQLYQEYLQLLVLNPVLKCSPIVQDFLQFR